MSLPDPHPTLGGRLHSGLRQLPGASTTSRFLATALLACGVLGGLGGLGLSLLFFAFALFGDPPDPAVAIGMAAFLGVASVGGGVVVGGGGWWWRKKLSAMTPTTAAIAVYEGGVAFAQGGTLTTLAWADIEGFRCPPSSSPVYGMKVSVPYSFFVVEGGGASFEARKMADLPEMGRLIEARLTPLRVEAALSQLQQGQSVRFGPLTLTPDGIRGFSIGSISWSDLQGIGVGRMNRLTAKERGVPVGQKGPFFVETPNVAALFTVVERMRG